MSGAPFLLRPAVAQDAPRCAYVHHTSWVETYSELLPASHWESDTLEQRTARWQRALDRGDDLTVAEVGGRVIGFARVEPSRVVGGHHPVRRRPSGPV